jgi:hypothetical protein
VKGGENMIKANRDEVHAQGLLNSIDNKLKVEALINLLVEKNVITQSDFEEKYVEVATEKKYKYASDLFGLTEEEFKTLDRELNK